MNAVAGLAWALVICWWFWLDRRHYHLRHYHLPPLEPRYRGPEDDPTFMDTL